jgi:glycosyltransferase involved in cell wall biosynthesis
LHYHSGGLNDFLGRDKWLKRLGSWIYGRGSWAITLSEHVKVPDQEFGACRLIEVPNGLDIEPSKHVKEKSDFLRILFLGNLYEDKGVFDLIRACQGIVDASSVKIHLQLVGKWPDEITEQIFRGLLAQAKENPQLEIPEPRAMYGDEKWAAYAEADLFVFPTYYQSENFPLVLLEAMASGLPVVSTRWRGIPSIVIENETGYLHDPGNLEQLQECIRKFIDAPDLLVGMGKKAKARYQHCFTFDKHKEKIRSLLTEACCAS